jgi:hypothetical protein
MLFLREVYNLSKEKVYRQWNGKNIDGQAELNNKFLAKEAASSSTSDMQCVVGVDTFSADDLQ